MKNKKVLIYYLFELILTICFFLIILFLVLKLTLLNKNYFINQLNKENYYHELYLEIDNDLENYLRPSGFDNSIKNNLFTEDEIKKVLNKNVDNFYNGKNIVVETTKLKENLERNIDDYLNTINIKITDEESLNMFKDEFIKIYKNRIIIDDKINNFSKTFFKYCKIFNIIIYSLIAIFLILTIIIKFVFRKITLSIPVMASILLYVIIYIYIISKINFSNIKFWNNSVSNIIKNFFFDYINYIKYICLVCLIIEFIKMVLHIVLKRKKFN